MKGTTIVANATTAAIYLCPPVLKLTGVVDWSWWAVTAPLWITGICLFISLIVSLVYVFRTVRRNNKLYNK